MQFSIEIAVYLGNGTNGTADRWRVSIRVTKIVGQGRDVVDPVIKPSSHLVRSPCKIWLPCVRYEGEVPKNFRDAEAPRRVIGVDDHSKYIPPLDVRVTMPILVALG